MWLSYPPRWMQKVSSTLDSHSPIAVGFASLRLLRSAGLPGVALTRRPLLVPPQAQVAVPRRLLQDLAVVLMGVCLRCRDRRVLGSANA